MRNTDLRSLTGDGLGLLSQPNAPRADHTPGLRDLVPGIGRIPLRAQPTRADGRVSATNGTDSAAGPVSGGGRSAPGGGHTDGHALRPARGRGDLEGPNFALQIPPDGYAWWYVDGVSACGTYAVSVIAFIGSVFSPWYRWSGRRDPHNHVCINVATYGPGGRFTMTDRGRGALRQSQNSFTVGPSSLEWDGTKLTIRVSEWSNPIVSKIEGTITVYPKGITGVELPLKQDGTHVWRPFAPTSDIAVDLGRHGRWVGHGYFDANFGTKALEADFSYWTWGRFPLSDGMACFYDAYLRNGETLAAAMKFTPDGQIAPMEAPPKTKMRRSIWAVRREGRADPGHTPKQVQSMLDAPFYNRSGVETVLNGEKSRGVYEALDLNRFRGGWLMPMLAVRVPRRPGWKF